MKHKEITTAVVGASFFAVPYLALSMPLLPSIGIGVCAYVAGNLVFKKDERNKLKLTNNSLYRTLENAKKQNNHILDMIPMIEDSSIQEDLNEINSVVTKIINTIEKEPDKEIKLNNFFEYYLPVTVKLVDRFDVIENQKMSTKESKKFLKSTGEMICEIKIVFQKFLNNLYESDMLDTKVEIKVLNQMLKADGLDENEIDVEVKKDE